MQSFLRLLLLAATLAFTPGCAFHRAWEHASSLPATAGDITGRWEGSWTSDENHHAGRLLCVITQSGADGYQAWFHATYRRVLTASYKVPLQATSEGDGFALRGEQNLGWYAGGVYHYEGKASATNFFSTYRCKYDHGTFQMARPE